MTFEHSSYPVLPCCSHDFIHRLCYEVDEYYHSQYGQDLRCYAQVEKIEKFSDWWIADVVIYNENDDGVCHFMVNLNLGIIL